MPDSSDVHVDGLIAIKPVPPKGSKRKKPKKRKPKVTDSQYPEVLGVMKFNHNHDSKGEFASSGDGGLWSSDTTGAFASAPMADAFKSIAASDPTLSDFTVSDMALDWNVGTPAMTARLRGAAVRTGLAKPGGRMDMDSEYVAGDSEGNKNLADAFVKGQYAYTQKLLADHGVKDMTLYRGLPQNPKGANPLESWTTDPDQANAFTYGGGYIAKATIPASEIFSIGGHGVGAANEHEVIALGNNLVPQSIKRYDAPLDGSDGGYNWGVQKFNHNHDPGSGQFASGPGGEIASGKDVTENPDNVRTQDNLMAAAAKSAGVTPDVMQANAQNAINSVIPDSHVTIVMSNSAWQDIKGGQAYQNVFNHPGSGVSDATGTVNDRVLVEKNVMGIPESVPGDVRPVYGTVNFEDNEPTNMGDYGNYHVVLKKDVNKRTTWTDGDTGLGGPNNPVVPSTMTNPSTRSLDWQAASAGDWGFDVSAKAGTPQYIADHMTGQLPQSFGTDKYLEAQVYGGVSLKDVDKVMDPSGAIIYQSVGKSNPNHDPSNGEFSSGGGYRGAHTAPTNDGYNMTIGGARDGIYPADAYTGSVDEAQRLYGSGRGGQFAADERSAISTMRAAESNPDLPVTVYRAMPATANGDINPGDWVTPSKAYADHHALANLGGVKGRVVSKTVPAKHLYTDGNSLLEWGYDPSESVDKYNHNHDNKGEFASMSSVAVSDADLGVTRDGGGITSSIDRVVAGNPNGDIVRAGTQFDADHVTDSMTSALTKAGVPIVPTHIDFVNTQQMADEMGGGVDKTGHFGSQTVGFYTPGDRGKLTVNLDSPGASFFATHEYGHLLDYENHLSLPLKSHVMTAIRNSAPYKGWVYDENGAYWSNPRETFARAFAQYVATKSGDKGMLSALGRQSRVQWTPEQFAPISDKMDKLFSHVTKRRAAEDVTSNNEVIAVMQLGQRDFSC